MKSVKRSVTVAKPPPLFDCSRPSAGDVMRCPRFIFIFQTMVYRLLVFFKTNAYLPNHPYLSAPICHGADLYAIPRWHLSSVISSLMTTSTAELEPEAGMRIYLCLSIDFQIAADKFCIHRVASTIFTDANHKIPNDSKWRNERDANLTLLIDYVFVQPSLKIFLTYQ